MKRIEKSVRLMIETILSVLGVYTPVWSSSVPTSKAVQDLKDNAAQIDKQATIQSVQTKGFTKTKAGKKKLMAHAAFDTAKKICAFATDSNDQSLFGKMKFTWSKLYYSTDVDARNCAQSIYDAAVALPAAAQTAYGIDPAILRTAIDGFVTVLTLPRNQTVIKHIATESIPTYIDKCREIIDNRIMNMMSNWRESNPTFYSQMVAAKKVLDSTQHTTIEGVVTANGVDLKNVKVTISSPKGKFEEMTDTQGRFKKQELNPEFDYSVTFELDGYESATLAVDDLKPGAKERLQVELKKAATA